MSWAIEHYDYYVKGRKFTIITDHMALKAMKEKDVFGNLKLERMRKRFQEYKFEIEYKKGETHIDADAISRIYETEDEKNKASKHVLMGSDGKRYWQTGSGEVKLYPIPEERHSLIENAHTVETTHRGRDAVVYELKKKYYWPVMQKQVMD
ncbi:hypothetical protein PAEPH01_2055, partial [Pancytospora epiphaga]